MDQKIMYTPSDYFSEQLKEAELQRRNGVFTLIKNGEPNKELNRIFGLPDVFVLTPSRRSIENFAALNYLFSLFGVKVKSFTSCKTGYIATFENEEGNIYGTFSSGDPLVLLEEIQKLARENGRKDIEDLLESAKKDHNLSLMDICKEVSPRAPKDKDEKNNPFFNNFKSVNDKNCDDNHQLICEILCDGDSNLSEKLKKLRNSDLFNGELSEEEIKSKIKELISEEPSKKLLQRKEQYDKILFGSILPGYFKYMGRDRQGKQIPQDGMVLNQKEIVFNIAKLLEYKKEDFLKTDTATAKVARHKVEKLVYLLNMGSTDYTADVVQDIFGRLLTGKEVNLDESIPPYKKAKEDIDVKMKKKYAHLGPNREHIANTLEEAER